MSNKNKGKLKNQASLAPDTQNLPDAAKTEDIVEETEEMEASDAAEYTEAEEVTEDQAKEEETPSSKEDEVIESHVNDLLEEAKTPISEEEKKEIIKDVSEFKDAVQKSIQEEKKPEEKKVVPPVKASDQSALLATDTKKFFVFIGDNMDEDKMRVVEDRLKKSEVDYVVTAIGGVYVGPYEDNAKAIAGRKKIIQKGLKGRIVEKRPSDLGAIATAVDQPND